MSKTLPCGSRYARVEPAVCTRRATRESARISRYAQVRLDSTRYTHTPILSFPLPVHQMPASWCQKGPQTPHIALNNPCIHSVNFTQPILLRPYDKANKALTRD